jgi:hypothetical protein
MIKVCDKDSALAIRYHHWIFDLSRNANICEPIWSSYVSRDCVNRTCLVGVHERRWRLAPHVKPAMP